MGNEELDYKECEIMYIINSIEKEINRSGKRIPKNDQCWDEGYLKKFPDLRNYREYSSETIKTLRKGIKALKLAQIYVHRIDWLFSVPEEEKIFLTKLKRDIKKLNEK